MHWDVAAAAKELGTFPARIAHFSKTRRVISGGVFTLICMGEKDGKEKAA
jgi:acyl dehydratase